MKEKKLESCYCPSYNITFIMEEIYINDEEATKTFYGKLKCKYEW